MTHLGGYALAVELAGAFLGVYPNGERYRLSVNCPGPAEVSEEARAQGQFPAAWRELCALRLNHGAKVQQLAKLPVNRLHDSGAGLLGLGSSTTTGGSTFCSISPTTTTRASRLSSSRRPLPVATSWHLWRTL